MKLFFALITAVVALAAGQAATGETLDTIFCTHAMDVCEGTTSADSISGTNDGCCPDDNGYDNIRAMAGNDTVSGNGGGDYISGSTGEDTLRGNGGNDTMYGGVNGDYMVGGDGNDHIYQGCDGGCSGPIGGGTMLGGEGNDVFGADNNYHDVVKGGPGDDHCWVDPTDYSESCVRH